MKRKSNQKKNGCPLKQFKRNVRAFWKKDGKHIAALLLVLFCVWGFFTGAYWLTQTNDVLVTECGNVTLWTGARHYYCGINYVEKPVVLSEILVAQWGWFTSIPGWVSGIPGWVLSHPVVPP